MKLPNFVSSYIINPAYYLKQNVLNKSAVIKYCQLFGNFVYDHSKETAFMLLIFNTISNISSHLAQIRGLSKSNRENKDYLISQEKSEMMLDVGLTIIPPFVIDHFMKKGIESGKLMSRGAKDKLELYVAGGIGGVTSNDLYNTEHLMPLKEQVLRMARGITSKTLTAQKLNPKAKNFIKKFDDAIANKIPDNSQLIPKPSMEDVIVKFHQDVSDGHIPKSILDKFYHGSAYDDIWGHRNGSLILSTIAYSIITTNIVIPILRNLSANRKYKKQLQKIGETPESMKRKKRYEYTKLPTVEPASSGTKLNIFEDIPYSKSDGVYITPPKSMHMYVRKNIFDEVKTQSSQSSGLRI